MSVARVDTVPVVKVAIVRIVDPKDFVLSIDVVNRIESVPVLKVSIPLILVSRVLELFALSLAMVILILSLDKSACRGLALEGNLPPDASFLVS